MQALAGLCGVYQLAPQQVLYAKGLLETPPWPYGLYLQDASCKGRCNHTLHHLSPWLYGHAGVEAGNFVTKKTGKEHVPT